MDKLPPIPTPVSQRWREFRIQVLPLIIFACVLLAVVFLWRNFVAPSGIVGEVEAIKADVISLQDGTVARLNVDRFEHVQEGQEIGEIVSSSEDLLKTSIAAIEADLRVMDARIGIDLQRNEQDLQQMRVDLANAQLLLASEKVQLIQASNTFRRTAELFHSDTKIVTPDQYDIDKANFERLQAQVDSRTKLINDLDQAIQKLQPANSAENTSAVDAAIKARIAELGETLKPVKLKAPMTGIISMVYHRPGERVVRGVPILTITAMHSDRVVGYLRQPINTRPTTNDTVIVRTRGQKRQLATGKIERIGSQMELINPVLLSTDSNRIELGLPFLVRLPEEMKLVPGEVVDISIVPPTEAK